MPIVVNSGKFPQVYFGVHSFFNSNVSNNLYGRTFVSTMAMAYVFDTTKERSALMGKIRARHTKPELVLRKKLWALGYRYRLHVKGIPGSPDIVFKGKKIAVFVDGEFWHGKDWELKKNTIHKNRDYWIPKIERNIQRDQQNTRALHDKGWIVLRFWQRDIMKELELCISTVAACIAGINH